MIDGFFVCLDFLHEFGMSLSPYGQYKAVNWPVWILFGLLMRIVVVFRVRFGYAELYTEDFLESGTTEENVPYICDTWHDAC